MAASSVQNPAAITESKTSKKKKAKAERTDSPAPTPAATSEKDGSVNPTDANGEELSEPAYLREIAKYAATKYPMGRVLENCSANDVQGTFAMSTRRL